LVATMSSYDEVYAAQEAGICPPYKGAFASQIDWIRWLVDYVSDRKDLFLIIRVHPREFPSRRERVGKMSDHARRLESAFAELPANCVINWPSDKVSLYDLAKDAEVVLNAWSSAGKEMRLLGLPVVEWMPDLLFYPPDDGLCALDQDEYGRRIERALSRGWCAEQVVQMYRWHVLEYGLSNFNTDYRQKIFDNRIFSLASRAAEKVLRRFNPFFAEAWFAGRRSIPVDAAVAIERMVKAGAPSLAHAVDDRSFGSKTAEAATLATEIRRLTSVLFGTGAVKYPLHRNLLELSESLRMRSQETRS
jgi:hypothetical protein